MKKNTITGFVAGALIFGTVGVFAGQYVATENTFPVKLNDADVSIEGYNIDGSTYFKLRDIADTVGGFTVDFQNDTILLSKVVNIDGKDDASYEEFNKLFTAQESILRDDFDAKVNGATVPVEIAGAIEESTNVLLTKALDIANLHLAQYEPTATTTIENIRIKWQSKNNELLAEKKEKNPELFTGGTNDQVTSATIMWDAAKEVLKQYYYELYKHTGTVEVDLTLG